MNNSDSRKRQLDISSSSNNTEGPRTKIPCIESQSIIMSSLFRPLQGNMDETCTRSPEHKRPKTTVDLSLNMDPSKFLLSILENDDSIDHKNIQYLSYESQKTDLTNFYFDPTPEEIDAYKCDVLDAVRSQDMETVQQYHKEGRPLKCSNRFGESLLHLACRQGLTKVATFLIEDANVPVQIRDDYGRNPAHDCCWASNPNNIFEVFQCIIQKCPDLLYLQDRRGYTPLSYARPEHWKKFNQFLLEQDPQSLVPKHLFHNKKQQQQGVQEEDSSSPSLESEATCCSSLKTKEEQS